MTTVCEWILTLALHATVLLGLAAVVDACCALRGAWRETLWRAALFGALLTASAQLLSHAEPLAGRWRVAATATRAAPPVPVGARAAPTVVHAESPQPALAPARVAAAPLPASNPQTRRERPAAPIVLPESWTAWVLAAWLAGVLVALARLAAALAQLRRAVRCARPLGDADLRARATAIAARAGVAGPELLVLDDLASPIALRGGRIVVPQWALDALDGAQLQAMVAHELGHVVRRDAGWKLAVASWRALLWFIPAAALAQRRLDALAELACDAFAARHTGDARGLAECLASCAERHQERRARVFDLAPAMASRSSLVERVERLLDGVYVDTSASGALSRSLAGAALVAAVLCLPAIGVETAAAAPAAPAAPAAVAPAPVASGATPAAPVLAAATPAVPAVPPAKSGHSSVSIHSDDDGDTMIVSMSDDAHKFSAKINGKIAFDDAETDVVSLGAGGDATFDETRDGVRRRLDVADRGGKLERHYYVDGGEKPIDAAARTWIASVVKQLERSGIGAEDRAKRLYAQGGAERVLDEIAQIPTDYVRGIYLRILVDLGKLSPPQLERALQAAGAMGSDYERRQALSAVFDRQALDAAAQATFLHQALRFDSDYERAELLIGAVPRLADSDAVRQAWLDAALQIRSDYEHRRTLEAMLARGGLSDAQLARIIEASGALHSDYEHRELLVAAVQRVQDREAIAPAYARSAQTIGSDYERREALTALLNGGRIGIAGAGAVLDAAAQLGSDYERREVLVALARVMPADAALQARYREVARKLPDYEREQAENALMR